MQELNEQKEKYLNLLDRLSKDHSSGRIPTERYKILSAGYGEKLASVDETIEKYEMDAAQNSKECNAEMFLDYLMNYHTGDDLDYDRLCGFLDRIVVHEREIRYSRKCDQEIEVYFR